MTGTFYKTQNYKADHTKFGGLIYLSDFNTTNRGKSTPKGSAIANRIALDRQFDIMCQKKGGGHFA